MNINKIQWRWEYFSRAEFFNPIFDDCYFNDFDEMPFDLQLKYQSNLDLLQLIRKFYGKKILITSTYRAKNSAGRPHRSFGAIDHQPVIPDKSYGHKVFEFINKNRDMTLEIIRVHNPDMKGLRAFWEYNGKNAGWLHTDIDYKDRYKEVGKDEIIFKIGYPLSSGAFKYDDYNGVSPIDKYNEIRK